MTELANLLGSTNGASIDTRWCVNCFNSGKHRQAQYAQPIQANESYRLSHHLGVASCYDASQYQGQVRATQQQANNRSPPLPDRPTEPRVSDYAVGWICAIEVEYVAACELLDQEFNPPWDIPAQDDNHYTCGRIGPHNVVMTCLPRGKYGLTSAASVATHMLRTFPSLRVRLMVGIGGGAPTLQNDIRLGDVVVSTPFARNGGVIHYEFGKTIQASPFEYTGQLNAPPAFLLAAVNSLSNIHNRKGHRINETVAAMIARNPRLQRLQRPDAATDVLFRSNFVHADTTKSCSDTCSLDGRNVIARRAREAHDDDPAIHYGLIASADRLMRDAEKRDRLSATEGVMCFEMEAAGLMDRFRCIVIRGISNYSDTHNNDIWQGYAASTAAAYAKELLEQIPPADVIRTEQPQFLIKDI